MSLSRRRFLQASAAAAALSLDPRGLVEKAMAATPTPCAGLSDIEHIVFFIQENRSFDHYFGTYRGVRGFSDPAVLRQPNGLSVFAQPGYAPGVNPNGHLLPFHLDTQAANRSAECTNDPTHNWGPQHASWAKGAMTGFVETHLAADGAANGPLTMGYYERRDLPFYYALADAFTVCDAYHCSVMGPTYPNRCYTVSATLDPDGDAGGPCLSTYSDPATHIGQFSWRTMPEVLEEAGISWKWYTTPDSQLDDVLQFFKAYNNPASPLFAKTFLPQFPANFLADVQAGTLPQVSWILSSVPESEHPPAPPEFGEYATSQILSILLSNPAVWEKTALFITYDENGGFFDHVPPPTPPPGTPGEYVTVDPLPSDASGFAGPIGLGFRVPALMVSPFSRGGLVCSETFDHTSMLRLLETRFGATVPNLSAWRRGAVGDLTAAFNFAAPTAGVPPLPATSLTDPTVLGECVPAGITGLADKAPPYPVPPNSMPSQEPGRPVRPSGILVSCAQGAQNTSVTAGPAPKGTSSPTSGSHSGALALTGGTSWASTAALLAAAGLGLARLRTHTTPPVTTDQPDPQDR